MNAQVAIADVPTATDLTQIEMQLGRTPRGVRFVRARCANGWPTVVETEPRLPDGTPFPTFYYLTCRTLNSAVSTLESQSLMVELAATLAEDEAVRREYQNAHQSYISQREAVATVPEIADFSAGGMPDRVKCLHALIAHSLAVGSGVNPIGDAALAVLVDRDQWPHTGPCIPEAIT